MDFITGGRLAFVAGGLAAYCIGLAVYRLYLCHVAKFPGPKLAALTLWYEFYYDVVKRGEYLWKIAEMHKHYGPIVRISPYELHIDKTRVWDSMIHALPQYSPMIVRYYDELYVGSSRKTMKYQWWRGFGIPA